MILEHILKRVITFSLMHFLSLIFKEVEYVKQEAKIVYLLECLQKTPPPVLIFAEKKQDVDAIHEYLLLKGVEAVAIHGGKGKLDFVSVALITCLNCTQC